jgi:hypothetical protein
MLSRERGVDDADREPGVEVVVGEGAPLEQFLARDVEEAAGDLLVIGEWPILLVRVDLALELDRTVAGEDHAEPAGEPDRVELGVGAQRAQQPVVEQAARVGGRVIAVHQAHPRRQDAVDVVAVVDRLLHEDRSHLQQRHDQQHAGDDQLKDDQSARDDVDAAGGAATAIRSTALALARDDIHAGSS